MATRTLHLTIIGALLVIGAAEIAVRAIEHELPVLSDWPTVETEIKSAQLNELAKAPSLLMVGSSSLEAAVDPAQLVSMGAVPEAYNSAFPFFSPAATEVWLEDFVQPWGSIDLLLIGLPAWPPPTDPADDPLTGGLSVLAEDDGSSDLLENLALWRVRGVLADLEEAVQREKSVANQLWTDLGHQTFYYGRSGDSLAGVFPPYGAPEMDVVQEGALRRILDKARRTGATPVIVLEPGRFPDPVSEETVADYIGWLESFAADLEVELWDTYSVEWDESFYADEAHFNDRGTLAYTRYLGELLIDFRARTPGSGA